MLKIMTNLIFFLSLENFTNRKMKFVERKVVERFKITYMDHFLSNETPFKVLLATSQSKAENIFFLSLYFGFGLFSIINYKT